MGVAPLRAKVRPPIVDGLFYPGKSDQLRALVDRLLAGSAVAEGSSFAVVSPHAGYDYAGAAMAAAFRSVCRRQVRTVFLLGPVHRDPQHGFFLPESESFSTPLGEIAVDERAAGIVLSSDPAFQRNDIFHLEEHCLEVQIPFILRVFPGASVVPILTGSRGMAAVTALSAALRAASADNPASAVFVISSNMASYMTGKDTEGEAAAMEDLVTQRDWRGMVTAEERKRISACGTTGIAAALSLAGSACKVSVLERGSSGDLEQGPSRTVHYAAISLDNSSSSD